MMPAKVDTVSSFGKAVLLWKVHRLINARPFTRFFKYY